MTTPREQAVAELRRSIDVLPERTRKAMLIGLGNNTVITGAFSGSGGACPMLAAHREGGRTRVCSFPEAWDKFTGVAGRHIVRPATEYEVQILRREIEASLEPAPPSELAEAIAEHQATLESRARPRDEAIAEHQATVESRARARDEAIAEHQATVEARARAEALAQHETPAETETRRRRLRITGGERIDLGEAINEHKSAARSRRSREADNVGLEWLFDETLVLPDDFGREPVAEAPEREFDFDAAESELTQ